MEPAKKLYPSLPDNYVSLLDLRERWMKRQELKKREESDRGKEVLPTVEVKDDRERAEAERDKGVVGDDHLEQNQPVKKSVFRKNPSPKAAPRKPSYGRSRPADTRNCRWVKVSQPKSSLAPPQNQPEQACMVTTMQPKPAPVARGVEQKAVPVHLQSKPKPHPSKAPRVESAVVPRGENRGSGGKADDLKLDRGIVEAKNRERKKQGQRNRRKKNMVESKPEKTALLLNDDPQGKEEILERGVAAVGGKKNVNDGLKTKIEEKLEDLSLNGGTGVSISRRSMAVRNPHGGRKDGGYGKFEDTIPLKKGRAKRGSIGVWVKKGEVSVMGAASVEKTSAVGSNFGLSGSCY